MIDPEGLSLVTHAEFIEAHSLLDVFPYRGGTNGALRLLYTLGAEVPGGVSALPPPSVQSREVVRMYAIRDGWMCHLCARPIDPAASILDKHRASPDHLIPRSHGGSDYPSNLRTAHLSCNKSRRDAPLTHGLLRESALPTAPTLDALDHIGKGREGKGREIGHLPLPTTDGQPRTRGEGQSQ